MAYTPPWKIACTGAVLVVAGVALFFVDWELPELVAFVAMLLIARGALHAVTLSFVGVTGALSALQAGAEAAVGLTLLAWPDPTLLVFAVVVGVLVLVQGTVDATVVLATRAVRPHWPVHLGADLVQAVLGVVLIARPSGTVHGTALTLGAIAVLAGGVEILTAGVSSRVARRADVPRAATAAAAVSV
jgi:uncharacterized membrane protein HdeD (DUF308 family)